MEDKDAHLFSVLQTRKLGVLARPRKVHPAGDEESDRDIARWVGRVLASMPGFNATLIHLLDALGKGMAVVEILWGFDPKGRIVPQGLKPRATGRFVRAPGDQWRLLEATGDPRNPGRPLPPCKFLTSLVGATDERPFGKGLCEKVYWYWWFKKQNVYERFFSVEILLVTILLPLECLRKALLK
jgi:phage gp29-like protein